jgi:hypothetical protein
MLSFLTLMDQAPVLDGLLLDLLPFCQNCRTAPEDEAAPRHWRIWLMV